jgi:hypothetical protein
MDKRDAFVEYIKSKPNFWNFLINNLGAEAVSDIFTIDHSLSETELKNALVNSDFTDGRKKSIALTLQEIGNELDVGNLIKINIGFNHTTCNGGILVLPLDDLNFISIFWINSDFKDKSEVIASGDNPIQYCIDKIISLLKKVEFYLSSEADFEGVDFWKLQIEWDMDFDIIQYCKANKLLDLDTISFIEKLQKHQQSNF